MYIVCEWQGAFRRGSPLSVVGRRERVGHLREEEPSHALEDLGILCQRGGNRLETAEEVDGPGQEHLERFLGDELGQTGAVGCC